MHTVCTVASSVNVLRVVEVINIIQIPQEVNTQTNARIITRTYITKFCSSFSESGLMKKSKSFNNLGDGNLS